MLLRLKTSAWVICCLLKTTGCSLYAGLAGVTLSGEQLRHNPKLLPVRIPQGAFGNDLPHRDLLVSPQHRILVSSHVVGRMFDGDEVLIAAKHLIGVANIDYDFDTKEVQYIHLLLDGHEILYANGAEAESLLLGKMAFGGLPQESRDELFTIFPALRDESFSTLSARQSASASRARRLLMRHEKNGHGLVAGKRHIL